MIITLLVQLGLHSLEQVAVENCLLSAREDLALERHLADVEAIRSRWASGPRVKGMPPTVLPDFRVRVLLTMPCLRRTALEWLTERTARLVSCLRVDGIEVVGQVATPQTKAA